MSCKKKHEAVEGQNGQTKVELYCPPVVINMQINFHHNEKRKKKRRKKNLTVYKHQHSPTCMF